MWAVPQPAAGVWLAVTLILAGWAVPARAQLRFSHLTVEDGLSHNWVRAIVKDGRGFLWIGTAEGLVRYDGASFKVYLHDPADAESLPGAGVRALFLDRRSRLWVGTSAGGALYDPFSDRFTPLEGDSSESAAEVYAIVEDQEDRIWIGSTLGLEHVDPEDGMKLTAVPIPAAIRGDVAQTRVSALLEGDAGRLWVGTGVGLLTLDVGSGEYERWGGAGSTGAGVGELAVNALLRDGTGAVWAGTENAGLFRLDPASGRSTAFTPQPGDPTSLSHPRVLSLALDSAGRLYAGTENGGLNVRAPDADGFSRSLPQVDDEHSLNSGSVWAVFVDDQDILWVGTFHGGVNFSAPFGARFDVIKPRRGGLNDPKVASILEDREGDLWIGTDGSGLNRVDGSSGAYGYYRHDPRNPATIGSDAVLALFEDSRGQVWVGGWEGGLGRLDRETGRVRRFLHDPRDPTSIRNNSVWKIFEVRTGELLVVTYQGVDLFDRDRGTFSRLGSRHVGSGEIQSYSALEDSRGDLWVGTFQGAERVEMSTGRVTLYRDDPELRELLGQDEVSEILEDRAGNVWLATRGGLVCVPASEGQVRRYTVADGLPHDNVASVVEDDSGSLWLGTNRGLSKLVDAVSLPAEPRFLNFDVHDGLQGQQFMRGSAHRSPSGRLYFGGTRGLNAFRPSDVTQNPHVPAVVLTELSIFNRRAVPGAEGSPLQGSITELEELELSYRHSVVTFEFAALNFVLPQKNQYRYMLEGFDEDWSPPQARGSATYTNLPGGSYVFRVRASNNDGVWGTGGIALPVRVVPPFWRTWWFSLAAGLTLSLGLVSGYRRRVQRIRDHAAELKREVNERTADLSRQIEVREEAEQKLKAEVEERARAERETRALAEELSSANQEMTKHQEALERENEDRRRAEEAAGRERDLLHALMDNIPELIYFKDAEGRFTRINRALATSLGLSSPEEAEGRSDSDFHDPELAREILEEERNLLRGAERVVGKLQHDARSGRWYLATKVAIRDEHGRATGLVGISTDVTARRESEAQLARDLEAFQQFVSDVAMGDLTIRSPEGEETLGRIGRSVNQMLEAFSAILVEVRDAAFAVSTSSAQILATSTQIAKGAQDQTDEVHLTSSAVEEMAASMKSMVEGVERSADTSQSVLEHVGDGDESVQVVYEGMTRIDRAVANTADKMRLLEERSRDVFKMIDLIEDVSAQSKLLSLNAAIEAAHAGDAGKGFGVVAEEIRRLAERSAEAIQDVTSFVEGIVSDTRSALEAMQVGLDEVAQGRKLAERARGSLEEISTLVKESAKLSAQISYTSREQAGAAQTAADSMQTVAAITHQSAAGAAETARAVQGLVDLSEQLNRTISRFRTRSHREM